MSNTKLFEIMSMMLNKNVAVFKEIKKMEMKEFFYTSYKFISDCVIYQRTQLVDAPWKADQYTKLEKQKDAVASLFDIYADIDTTMGAYFKPTYCLARLTDFFKETNSPRLSLADPVSRQEQNAPPRVDAGTETSGFRKR
jgi:hypothetical protein